MYTCEQFVDKFLAVARNVAWNNTRVYTLTDHDHEDLLSELRYRVVRWYYRYPNHVGKESDACLGSMIKIHLNHKAQEYCRTRLKHHFIPCIRLDHASNTNQNDHELPEIEDPRQLKELLSAENNWIWSIIKHLDKEDQDQLVEYMQGGFKTEYIHVVLRRFKRVMRCIKEGRPIPAVWKRHKNDPPRPPRKPRVHHKLSKPIDWEVKKWDNSTLTPVVLDALKRHNNQWDIAKEIGARPNSVGPTLQRLRDQGRVEHLGIDNWVLVKDQQG